jgi:hypothetical protein
MSPISRLALISCLFLAQASLVQALPVAQTPSPAPSPAQTSPVAPATSPTIGLYFSAEQGLNNAKFQGIRYVGECPGGQAAIAQAKFISSKTPPAPGLRVVIRNNSDLVEGRAPFSDRGYDQGKFSERIVLGLDNQHRQSFLAMQSGVNRMSYEIKRGEAIVESGAFDVTISNETTLVRRDARWVDEAYDFCTSRRGNGICRRTERRYRSVSRCPA